MLSIRCLKQPEETAKKKTVRVIRAGLIIVAAIFFLEIWIVNRLSTYGYKIAEIKSLQSELKLENQIMENQISQKASLSIIEEKATKVGFNDFKKVDYYRPPNIASAL